MGECQSSSGGAKVFGGGQIFIQLQENQISFVAGQVIQGFVHINMQQAFDATNITVGLYGSEETYFRKRHRRGKSHYYRDHTGFQEILAHIFPIQQFVDGPPPVGQYTYPFALQVPDWLPASMMLGGEHEQARLAIKYSIRAQFTPRTADGWASAKLGISAFRGTRMIYIQRPSMQFPKRDLKYSLKSDVGGFLGMGTSQCVSDIFFEKNEYYLGETANVRVICDNSACGKPIRSFKFKLHRHYKGHDDSHWTTTGSSYLIAHKEHGCPAGEKGDFAFKIVIPTQDTYQGDVVHKIHPDEIVMLKSFSTSVTGKLISVCYTLKCFVKHDAWNEFGEGNVVSLPIKIL